MSFPEEIKVGDICYYATAYCHHFVDGRKVSVDYHEHECIRVTPKGARFIPRHDAGSLRFWRECYGSDPTCKPCDDKGTWYPFQARSMHDTRESALEQLKIRTARRRMHNLRRLRDVEAILDHLEVEVPSPPTLLRTRSVP